MSLLTPKFLVAACLTAALSNNALARHAYGSPWGWEEEAERVQKQREAWGYAGLFEKAAGAYDFPFGQECYAVRGQDNKNLAFHRTIHWFSTRGPASDRVSVISDDEFANGIKEGIYPSKEFIKCIDADHFIETYRPVVAELKQQAAELLAKVVLNGNIPDLPDENIEVRPDGGQLRLVSTLEKFINGDTDQYDLPALKDVLEAFSKTGDAGDMDSEVKDMLARTEYILNRTDGWIESRGSYLQTLPVKVERAKQKHGFEPLRPDLYN